MAMGMSPEEYWHGDPYLVVQYRKAWDLRKEQRNHELWWQGWYIYEALVSVLSPLTRKGKPFEYPKEPHRLTPLTEPEKQAKKIEVHNQLTSYFQAKKEAFERNNGGRNEQH